MPGTYLFCLIYDVTEATALEQQVRQKKYEVELVKSGFLNKNRFLSDSLLGQSDKLRETRNFINKVSRHSTTVLLQGDSGTGKSLVTRLIHNAPENPKTPFVEINCAAIPATLLESELFGYDKGAFTNALMSKKGLIEAADGGTLFLDEIGEMPPSLQAKLLTFLETRRFRRLGSTKEQSVSLRLIAATNRDLQEASANNEFRRDLYFRINVVSIHLPALRELRDDILVLANHFVSVLCYDLNKNIRGFTRAAQRKLQSYDWPGNVRELRNVIERAMIFTDGALIDAADLLLTQRPASASRDDSLQISIPEEGLSREEVEKTLLCEALRKTRGNQSKSAQLLGLSLDTFRYRLKKFSISPKDL